MRVEIETDEKFYLAAELIEGFTSISPSAQTISRICKSGRLKAHKVMGKWMCRKQDFFDYIESSTAQALEAPVRELRGINKTRSEAKRQRDIAAAEASLEADGVV